MSAFQGCYEAVCAKCLASNKRAVHSTFISSVICSHHGCHPTQYHELVRWAWYSPQQARPQAASRAGPPELFPRLRCTLP